MTFLDMPSAAKFYGCSVRHFTRIVKEEKIKVIPFPTRGVEKFFVLLVDVERLKRVRPFVSRAIAG